MSDNLFWCLQQKFYVRQFVLPLFCTVAYAVPNAALAAEENLHGNLPDVGGFVQLFDAPGAVDGFYHSNFDFGGDKMATGYRKERIAQDPVSHHLLLNLAPAPHTAEKAYWGAEIQRDGGHSYGAYEVVMQPAKASGVISSFFTYTGGQFKDAHHEIDIEFLGKDTTGLYANLFVDGAQMPGVHVPLGFDAAEGLHLYRFEWRAEGVRWFADGKEIFRADADETPIPILKGKLFANIWAVTPPQEGWAGKVAPETEAQARYACMSYVPEGGSGQECHDFGPWADE